MELVYAGLLLHSAGKDINEANLESVMKAAGADADKGTVKAFLAALDGVDIEEAISKAAVAPAAAAPAAAESSAAEGESKADEKKEEEDEGKKEEEAAAGLGALFG